MFRSLDLLGLKTIAPGFFLRSLPAFLALILANAPVAQALDLDNLLDAAEDLESPLERGFVCDSSSAVGQSQAQSNGVVTVSIMRVCFDPVRAGSDGTPVLVVEGRLVNPARSGSLDVLPAHRLFRLEEGDTTLAADMAFEAEILGDFARPLPPLAGREFAVAFALSEARSNWTLVHPSQAGTLRVPVAEAGSLITGAQLPGLPVRVDPETAEQERDDLTADILRADVATREQGSPSTATAEGSAPVPVSAPADIAIKRRDGYSDLPGFLISREIFGGTVTRLDQPPVAGVDPIFLDWTADKLNDGNTYFTFRTHSESVAAPSSFAVTFAEGRTARIAAVRTHADPSEAFTFHHESVAIYISQNGIAGPWEQVGESVPVNYRSAAEEFLFSEPVTANAVRIDFIPDATSVSYRGSLNQSLGEIEIVEALESDSYISVLNDATVNALDPALGGHLVAFTSQFNESDKSAASVLAAPDQTSWQPLTTLLPQEMVFAFEGHDIQSIDRVTASIIAESALPADWAPHVRAEVSADASPLRGYQEIGSLTADPTTRQLALDLAEPVAARYLKLVIIDPGASPFGVTSVTARGKLVRVLGADPLFQRTIADAPLGDDNEVEPDNNTVNGATPLAEGVIVRGRPNTRDDVDHYRINIAGPDVSAVTLRLTGLPRVKARVSLADERGQLIANLPATGTATEQLYTWILEPGSYTVSLRQDVAALALYIDNSRSLGPAIIDALDAAEEFVTNKTPEEELSLHSFSQAPVTLVERTADSARLTEAIDAWRNSPDAGQGNGTTVYDSIIDGVRTLSDVAGNKAVVLFTDGADATSRQTPSDFWHGVGSIDAPVFVIGYGADMAVFYSEIGSTAGDAMRSIGLATEGGFYPAPTPAELPAVFAQISERVRAQSGYEVSYTISPGMGELEVLDAGGQMVSSGVLGTAIVIFDASGSMRARTDAGRQRINVARSVLFDLLEQVPEAVPMGVWLYGHSRAADPKPASCRDVELLVPPAPGNRDQIKAVAKAIAPKGQTPIGYALAQAGEALAGYQAGLVILLTDGEETCDADAEATYNPDRVVQALIDQGIDLRVNIVGFDVDDPKIQAELARVAERTGGTFFFGAGQDGLREAMTSAFRASIDVLDDTGRIVAIGRVGDGPIALPQGNFRIRVSDTDFISNHQRVQEGRATRVFLSQEASAIRVRVEDNDIGAPYTEGTSSEAVEQVQPVEFNPDARVPETPEELVFKTQDLLAKLGFDPGPLDGAMGGKTRRAAQAFLANNGPLVAGDPFDAGGNPTLFLWFELFASFQEQRG